VGLGITQQCHQLCERPVRVRLRGGFVGRRESRSTPGRFSDRIANADLSFEDQGELDESGEQHDENGSHEGELEERLA
jgi:hypothetical protein